MRKKPSFGSEGMNMTPMIDIVFQMIIFFVCTVQLEKDAINEKIRLALAPHGPEIQKKDPSTIIIDVDDRGQISISRRGMSVPVLQAVLRKTMADYGRTVPVMIRADELTRHAIVKQVMDSCSKVGIWRIQFAAIKEKVN